MKKKQQQQQRMIIKILVHHLLNIKDEHFLIVIVMEHSNKLFLYEVIVLHVLLVIYHFDYQSITDLIFQVHELQI